MPNYKYIAKDDAARTITGTMAAESQVAVVDELRKRKLIIISVAEVKPGIAALSFGGKNVKTDDLVIFTRQLATMIDAGIPILQTLEALHDQMEHPYFKSVIASLREDVEVGSSLAVAFSKFPHVFDTLFVSMVKVGESGGILTKTLDRIAGYMEKSLKLKRKVQAALVYPIVVITMAVLITLVLLIKVVPTFKAIYQSLGHDLPFMTQILLGISDGLQKYLLVIIGLMVVLGFFFRRYGQTEKGRLMIDKAKLNIPIFGDLLRKVAISRFSRTLSTLIQSGVPILASLDIVGKTCGNKLLEMTIEKVRDSVREGENIAGPLQKSNVFPAMVTKMIDVGEKSGEMEKMLTKIADFYEDQVDAAVSGLTSMIEPLIIGFLGIVVGFIVIALFLPIIKMTTMLN